MKATILFYCIYGDFKDFLSEILSPLEKVHKVISALDIALNIVQIKLQKNDLAVSRLQYCTIVLVP